MFSFVVLAISLMYISLLGFIINNVNSLTLVLDVNNFWSRYKKSIHLRILKNPFEEDS